MSWCAGATKRWCASDLCGYFLHILTLKRGEALKILLLIDALGVGGAETHVITLAKGLLDGGHTVAVLSSGGVLERALTACGVTVYHFPTASLRRASFVLSACRCVRTLRRLQKTQNFDVMHAHTRRTALLLRLFRASERLRPAYKIPHRLSYRRRALRRLFSPALVVSAHARFAPCHRLLSFWGEVSVAVSDDLREHLLHSFGVPRERICVVPNGIDGEVFHRPPTDTGATDVLRITFASRLDGDCSAAAKSLVTIAPALLREAQKRGKRLRLTILGGGDHYQQIAEAAKRVNAQSGLPEPLVVAVGATDRVADCFRQTDVFVGVSRAALEALACGCLVILAGDEGFGGLLTEQNFDVHAAGNFCCRGLSRLRGEPLQVALTEHVLCAMDMDKEQSDRLVAALSARVRQEYGAASMCERISLIYKQILTKKRRLYVLIGGYAGCGNLGDDAILRCLIERWHRRAAPASLARPDAPLIAMGATLSLTALSGDQGKFDIPCVPRRRWSSVARSLWRADAFVLGGGALLQNCSPHGSRSLAYYLALLWLARLTNCPCSLVANGIGPLRGRLAKRATITILQTVKEISLRDEPSLSYLKQAKIPPDRLSFLPDPALSVVPDPTAAARLLGRDAPCPFVCIIPRASDEKCLRELGEAVKKLWREHGVYPLFFAFDRVHDVSVCQQLMHSCGAGKLIVTEQEKAVAGAFARSVGVISMRLHGLILAHAASARALCLAYSDIDRKTVAFAASVGQTVAKNEKELRKILYEWAWKE